MNGSVTNSNAINAKGFGSNVEHGNRVVSFSNGIATAYPDFNDLYSADESELQRIAVDNANKIVEEVNVRDLILCGNWFLK